MPEPEQMLTGNALYKLHPCHTKIVLPSDAVALGSEMEFTSGTTITVMEDSIIQHVVLEKQPHLVDQLAALQQLYRASKASEYLIQSEDGPQICTKHTVTCLVLVISLGLGLSQSE